MAGTLETGSEERRGRLRTHTLAQQPTLTMRRRKLCQLHVLKNGGGSPEGSASSLSRASFG